MRRRQSSTTREKERSSGRWEDMVLIDQAESASVHSGVKGEHHSVIEGYTTMRGVKGGEREDKRSRKEMGDGTGVGKASGWRRKYSSTAAKVERLAEGRKCSNSKQVLRLV
jgi:hypothetical protein